MAIERVSVASNGQQGNGWSGYSVALSADGQDVVFTSDASNLAGPDANGTTDVFLHDRRTGETIRLSQDNTGAPAAQRSGLFEVAVSGDGRFVAFHAQDPGLAAQEAGPQGGLYLHDRLTGLTTLVPLPEGVSTGLSPSLSDNGRVLAAVAVSDDPALADQIFVADLVTGTARIVSVTGQGAPGNGSSATPHVSAEGTHVAFASDATDLVAGDTNGLRDIFRHDLSTGGTERVSLGPGGAQTIAAGGEGASLFPTLSGDGRAVLFQSHAPNLVAGDDNGTADVFLRDLATGTTERLTVAPGGTGANDTSRLDATSLSADGRFAVFGSYATNLDDAYSLIGTSHVYVHDRVTGETALASLDETGAPLFAEMATISADGSTIAFATFLPGVAADDNFAGDVYVTANPLHVPASAPYAIAPDRAWLREGETVTFTITRADTAPAEEVIFGVLPGTASAAEGDVALADGGAPHDVAIAFSPGAARREVTLTVPEDGVADTFERFRAEIRAGAAEPAAEVLARSRHVTIGDALSTSTDTLPGSASTGAALTESVWFDGRIDAEPAEARGPADGTGGHVDLDWIAVELARGQRHRIEATPTTITTGEIAIVLREADGTARPGAWAAGAAPVIELDTAGQDAATQQVFVEVRAAGPGPQARLATGDYALRWSVVDGTAGTDPTPAPADTVAHGTGTQATLTPGLWRGATIDAEPAAAAGAAPDGAGGRVDTDWYRLSLEADRRYVVTAEADGITSGAIALTLHDASGTQLDSASGAQARLVVETGGDGDGDGDGDGGGVDRFVALAAAGPGAATATGDARLKLHDFGPSESDQNVNEGTDLQGNLLQTLWHLADHAARAPGPAASAGEIAALAAGRGLTAVEIPGLGGSAISVAGAPGGGPEAVLHAYEARIDGARALLIAFGGVAEPAGWLADAALWPDTYAAHAPQIRALLDWAAGAAGRGEAPFGQLYLTGHGFGGVMVENFLAAADADRTALARDAYAVTFGSPGAAAVASGADRLLNVVTAADPVAALAQGTLFGAGVGESLRLPLAELFADAAIDEPGAARTVATAIAAAGPAREGTTLAIAPTAEVALASPDGGAAHARGGPAGYAAQVAGLVAQHGGDGASGPAELDYWLAAGDGLYATAAWSAPDATLRLPEETRLPELGALAPAATPWAVSPGLDGAGGRTAALSGEAALSITGPAAPGIARGVDGGWRVIEGDVASLSGAALKIDGPTLLRLTGHEGPLPAPVRRGASTWLEIDRTGDGAIDDRIELAGAPFPWAVDPWQTGETVTVLIAETARLAASAGDDVLRGTWRDERLAGGAGDDLLIARNGADTLAGGAGDDTLAGGRGPDVFEIAREGGVDRIVDFVRGTDRLDLTAFSRAGALDALGQASPAPGGGTRLVFPDGTEAWLDGIGPGTLTAEDAMLAPPPQEAGPGPGAADDVIWESHRITLDAAPRTIAFDHAFDAPVVIAQAPSGAGAAPVGVRIRAVSETEVTLALEPPVYIDAPPLPEEVSVLVVEAGVHRLADGTLVQAGTLTSALLSSAGFESVAYDAAFAAAPTLLTQVQSRAGSDFVVTRQRNADAAGFEVVMQEEERRNDGGHVPETLGWVALDSGAGALPGGGRFEADTTGHVVDHDGRAIAFAAPFKTPPDLVTALASYRGPDVAMLRRTGPDAEGFGIRVQEEQSADAELFHVPEAVSWLATGASGPALGAPLRRIGEVHTIALSDAPYRLDFGATYDAPVVIASAPTRAEAQAAAIRIDGLTGTGAVLRLAEPADADGAHASETVGLVVVEAGRHVLADGTRLEAGTLEVARLRDAGTAAVSFDHGFAETPVVLSQIQTRAEPGFLTTRHGATDGRGFELALERGATEPGPVAAETVGWLAVAPGSGTWSGKAFAAGRTAPEIDAAGWQHDFPAAFGATPALVAGFAGSVSPDPAQLRLTDIDADGFAARADYLDAVSGRAAAADYLAFDGTGALHGFGQGTVIAQAGRLDLDHRPVTVELAHSFEEPVVIAATTTSNGGQDVNVRLAGLTADSLTLALQEPAHLDGWHVREEVSFLVVEAGTWRLADGTVIEAGMQDISALGPPGLEAVSFGAPFAEAPVLVSHVQAQGQAAFLDTRQDDVTADGALLTIEAAEAQNSGPVGPQAVGWLAVEPGPGVWATPTGGLGFEAGRSQTPVGHAWETLAFDADFTAAPVLLAGMTSYASTDPAVLRVKGLSGAGAQLRAQEDTSADRETWHAPEEIAYLGLAGEGLLTGDPFFA